MTILAAVLTVLTGTLIYVVGQLVQKIFINPVTDLRRTIGEIAHVYILNVPLYFRRDPMAVNPFAIDPTSTDVAAAELSFRQLAGKLHTCGYLVPCKDFILGKFGLPTMVEIEDSASALILIANLARYDGRERTDKFIAAWRRIEENLRITTLNALEGSE